MASITQNAAAWLCRRYGCAVQLMLVPGGCAGYLYKWSARSDCQVLLLHDHNLLVYTDDASYPYISGVEIALDSNLLGSAIWINNPAAGGCGCSKSIPAMGSVSAQQCASPWCGRSGAS